MNETVRDQHMETGAQPKFKWLLPVLGALGFGLGFAVMGAIMLTMFNIAENSFSRAFGQAKVGFQTGALRGIICGGLGGAALGLAYKDKMRVFIYALAGAMGFGIAFALVISMNSSVGPDLGRAVMRLMGSPVFLSPFETGLAHGLGPGIIIGAIGGLVLGFAAPKYAWFGGPLLCWVGMLAFGNIFAFGNTIYDGNFFSPWNAVGGALGGAALGLALALLDIAAGWLERRKKK